jgi:mono/diheme cytochrome c family protein
VNLRFGNKTRAALLIVFGLTVCGCGAPDARFVSNRPWLHNVRANNPSELTDDVLLKQEQQIADVLVSLFGTPDDPNVPQLPELDLTTILDPQKLQLAAGSVKSDYGDGATPTSMGLYREHCVHCHGISGDGRGPTAAFLNPYPRDYRPGKFKFKSTPKGVPPAMHDLEVILKNGIQGTAMPSFKLLAEDEVQALSQYVIYLSIRGQVERALMSQLTEMDTIVDRPASKDATSEQAYKDQWATVLETVSAVSLNWIEANAKASVPPPIPAAPEGTLPELIPNDWETNWMNSPEVVERGRKLFYGPIANCVKCHGETASGDGQQTDYDDWTKEIEPEKPQRLEEYLALGALPPRNIIPRNLRRGVFRGGRRPVDIYWRIREGIDGSPMPAAQMLPEGAPPGAPGLTNDDVWSLVAYVLSLQNESLSKSKDEPTGLAK